jgi:hypothetical protein
MYLHVHKNIIHNIKEVGTSHSNVHQLMDEQAQYTHTMDIIHM